MAMRMASRRCILPYASGPLSQLNDSTALLSIRRFDAANGERIGLVAPALQGLTAEAAQQSLARRLIL